MTSVLIADTSKSSIVMTSEIFKDKILGVGISIVDSGSACIEKVGEDDFDMVVVDFDLPDTDGVTLCRLLRKVYTGPVLITAYPDKVVRQAIDTELFAYNDSMDWLEKPVSVDKLNGLIQKYLLDKKRVRKRYSTELGALVSGKGAGRGRRAPKVRGHIINLSIGGARLELDNQLKMKAGEEVSLTLYHSHKQDDAATKGKTKASKSKKTAAKKKTSKKTGKSKASEQTLSVRPEKGSSSRIKAKIAWSDKSKKLAGLSFEGLTENNRKALERLLRSAKEISD